MAGKRSALRPSSEFGQDEWRSCAEGTVPASAAILQARLGRSCKRSDPASEIVSLAHGSGGRKMHRLIQQVFIRHFANPALRRMEDAAVLRWDSQGRRPPTADRRPPRRQAECGARYAVRGMRRMVTVPSIALTTDSYVVHPLFFPGGDIGKLAVCGTVNDLSVMGATPKYLSAGFIIGAGFPLTELERICCSMAATAKKAGVEIVTGDTKVVGATQCPTGQTRQTSPTQGPLSPLPELFINTSGVGVLDHNQRFGAEHIRPGDRVLINGSIGDHEAAIVLARGEFEFSGTLRSDCASLNGLIHSLTRSGAGIRMMRDPTRGGVATTLNEIAEASGLGIIIDEANLSVKPKVLAVCALLGFEPLYLANEGKVLVVVAPDSERRAISVLRRHPLGASAAVIAEVTDQREGVWLKTRLGSLRPVLMLEGQQLPRIC